MAIRRADIEERIYKVREHLRFLEKHGADCEEIFENDPILKDALLYNLYLLSDRVVRLAEAVCKYKNAGYPETYSGFIYRLGEIGVLEKAFAYRFAAIARFRNFLAHENDAIDEKEICKAMVEGQPDVERFLENVEQAL